MTQDTSSDTDEEVWKDAEVLESLYWEDELSQSEIADTLDTETSNVQYWMKKHDIDRRDQREVAGNSDIADISPEHGGIVGTCYNKATDILGTDADDLTEDEIVDGFLTHDELVIRFNCRNHSAYYITFPSDGNGTDNPYLYRNSTAPTSVELDSTYVQSLFDQYNAMLVHEDAISNIK